jgi:hypothetical protein
LLMIRCLANRDPSRSIFAGSLRDIEAFMFK